MVVNGACGRVIGTGTRSSSERPNLSVHADLADMDPAFCGGFNTAAGPECITSVASAIPVIDKEVLAHLLIRDSDISLPIVDISNRQPVGSATYDQVWNNTATSIRYHKDRCQNCSPCAARASCPVDAIQEDGTINQHTCFVCGTCVKVCKGSAYEGDIGSLSLGDMRIPIVLRQSDRRKAEILCRRVKDMLIQGEFLI